MDNSVHIDEFKQLFRLYYPLLCGVGRGYISNMVVVEEIVDDVFVKFWNNNSHRDVHTSVKDYLCKAVKNSCIDYIRREQKLLQRTSNIEDHEIVNTTLADLGENPLDYLIKAETEQQIMDAINELPERYRQTFVLCRLEKIRYEKVAQMMGITKNTVKSNLREALALLLKKLKNVSLTLLFCIF